MKYEVVELSEKKVAGIRRRTSNGDANMSSEIGMAWQKFFGEGIYASIPGKINDKTLGVYTNFENDVNGAYDVLICCEVEADAKLPEDVSVEIMPKGKYAKFVIRGDVKEAVQTFWIELWSMDLDRRYCCDFEEYQGGDDLKQAEIHVYISLN
ncbi:GyrI-like domain-containing protein [Anaerotignum sp.]|uniref:GyrI-like domain-containing protein n=1 Tax=Anaerotignum sp. TaxID=2039241 RepID=UPI00289EB461|nr:GyrI-like domain-containing protein [Anaerotignum sp.]